jgi:hypothetical protein
VEERRFSAAYSIRMNMGFCPEGQTCNQTLPTFPTNPASVILARTGTPVSEDTVRLQPGIWALSICLLSPISGNAQNQAPSVPPQMPGQPPKANGDVDETQQRLAHDMAKKANIDRHAMLKADTDKLLKLALELKNSVDKSNENLLSLDVLKKAEEIEKLAHSVKDKMKGPN